MTFIQLTTIPCLSLLSVGITSVSHDSWLCAGLLNADVHPHCPEMSSQACLVTSWLIKGTHTALIIKKKMDLLCPFLVQEAKDFCYFNLCLEGRAHM